MRKQRLHFLLPALVAVACATLPAAVAQERDPPPAELPCLLAFGSSDSCEWCKLLERRVFATDVWREWADAHVAFTRVDLPRRDGVLAPDERERNNALADRLGVKGIPTFVLLAADGNLSTRWSSEYTDPSWLLLDLGETKTVGAATIYFETACSADFTIEVSSDGENFTEAASVEGNSAAGVDAPVVVLFSEPFQGRYVRFNGLSRATEWGHSIWELELYAGIPGEAACTLEYVGNRINVKLDGKTYLLSKES